MKILISIIFTLLFFSVNAQIGEIDSLINKLSLDKISENKEVYIEIAERYASQNDYETSIFYYQKAISNIKPYTNQYGRISYIIGDYNFKIENYSELLNNYNNILTKYNNDIDELLKAKMINSIGLVYIRLKQNKKAKTYFDKAIKLLQNNNSIEYEEMQAVVYLNYGIYYDIENNEVLALEYYKKAEKIYRKLDDKSGLFLIELNIGLLDESKKSIKDLETVYLKAIENAKLSNNNNHLISTYINWGGLLLEHKQTKRAISYFTEANKLASQYNIVRLQMVSLEGIYTAYKIDKKYNKAFEYLQEYMEVKNKYFDNEIVNKTILMDTKFRVNEKEKQNIILERENELIEKRLYLISFLSIGLVVFILVFFIITKTIKSKNKSIVERNIELLEFKKNIPVNNTKQEYKSEIDPKIFNKIKSEIDVLFRKEQIFTKPDLNLNLLADRIGYNRKYISEVINKTYNKSVSAFIKNNRINLAQQYLLDAKKTNLTIEAIGYEVGFKSKSVFYRTFKEETGVTPNDYMKSLKSI